MTILIKLFTRGG